MKSLHRQLLVLIFWLCRRTVIQGIEVGVLYRREFDLCQTKIREALALIQRYDPIRFTYFQRDVKRIMVFGRPGRQASWSQAYALCELTDTHVEDLAVTPAILASTIVHEAMHARLYRWGFKYKEAQRVRIESICFKASLSFARRLPNSEVASRDWIIQEAQRQLQRDPEFWTDAQMFEMDMSAIRTLGGPEWVVRLLRWRRKFKTRKRQSG